MTSGRGILHEEMPQRSPNGVIYGFQLWVNLPAKEKMGQPRYQEVSAASIPSVEKDGVSVRVVAGEFGGVRGPVSEIAAQPLYMDVTVQPGAEFALDVPFGHTTIAYIFEGGGLFGVDEDGRGEPIEAVRMAIFTDGNHLRALANRGVPVRFMLMAGAPFREPIFPYGPFVMNTMEEIQQTLIELRNGTFIKA
ncbi:MAG: pirin-like C-terminal cupin domain-containing protein [Anaerolineales bacterium]